MPAHGCLPGADRPCDAGRRLAAAVACRVGWSARGRRGPRTARRRGRRGARPHPVRQGRRRPTPEPGFTALSSARCAEPASPCARGPSSTARTLRERRTRRSRRPARVPNASSSMRRASTTNARRRAAVRPRAADRAGDELPDRAGRPGRGSRAPAFPYSVFLGPGAFNVDMPQVYLRDLKLTVAAALRISIGQSSLRPPDLPGRPAVQRPGPPGTHGLRGRRGRERDVRLQPVRPRSATPAAIATVLDAPVPALESGPRSRPSAPVPMATRSCGRRRTSTAPAPTFRSAASTAHRLRTRSRASSVAGTFVPPGSSTIAPGVRCCASAPASPPGEAPPGTARQEGFYGRGPAASGHRSISRRNRSGRRARKGRWSSSFVSSKTRSP